VVAGRDTWPPGLPPSADTAAAASYSLHYIVIDTSGVENGCWEMETSTGGNERNGIYKDARINTRSRHRHHNMCIILFDPEKGRGVGGGGGQKIHERIMLCADTTWTGQAHVSFDITFHQLSLRFRTVFSGFRYRRVGI